NAFTAGCLIQLLACQRGNKSKSRNLCLRYRPRIRERFCCTCAYTVYSLIADEDAIPVQLNMEWRRDVASPGVLHTPRHVRHSDCFHDCLNSLGKHSVAESFASQLSFRSDVP